MNRRDFRKYFKDDLHYPEIQRPGPLALLAEAEGLSYNALLEAGHKLREQFFPELAEKESVIIHGQSRGVPRHQLEDDDLYRIRVKHAWAWAWLSGRYWGFHKIFADYGFPVIDLTELKGDHWAEFDLNVESPHGWNLDDAVFELVTWIIFEYKRASAMLRTLRLTKRVRGRVILRTATLAGEHITVYPKSV